MPSRSIRPEDREELLRHLRLCYWRTLNRLDDAMGSIEITARQYLLLKALEEEGSMGSRAICETLSVTPADVTGLSTRLERKRYVRRIRSLEDRRRVILEITDTGRKALDIARKKRDKVVDALIGAMPTSDFRSMIKGMDSMLSVLGATPGAKAAGKARSPPERDPPLEAPTT